MSYPVYMVPAGDVLPIFFDTFAGATGASITTTGLAVTDIEIYKDGSTTQRASDAGYTLLDTDGIDFDGLTGIHGFSIDTGDNTDAGFYTVGAWFHVVVSAITVDSQTVSFVAAAFRLMPAEGIAGHPKVDVGGWLGTACATPTTNGVPEVDITHVGGSAVSASSGLLNANVTQLSGDSAAADNAEAWFDGTGYASTNSSIASVTGAVGSVTGNVGGNIVGYVTSVQTNGITSDSLAASAIAEIAAGVVDLSLSGHTTAGTVGAALYDTDLRGSRVVGRGTVGASPSPTTTTFTASAMSPSGAVADQFKGRIIVFDSNTTTAALRGQATDITANSSASLPAFTFSTLTTAPASGDTFTIV